MGWGSIVSAGASLVGGLMGKKSGEEQQENNAALQKEFAQNGIRWKVADAKAAGIHPLAALGAQTQSYTPMVIGDPMADALANAGQDIGGAINRQQTNQERADTMAKQTAAVAARQKVVDGMATTRANLENSKLQSEIALLNSQIRRNMMGMPPPMPDNLTQSGPTAAQRGGPGYVIKPAEVTASGSNPAVTAGVNPGFSDFRIGGKDVGFNIQLPSAQTGSEAFESMGEILAPLTVGTHWALQGIDSAYNAYKNRKPAPQRNINTNPRYRPRGY